MSDLMVTGIALMVALISINCTLWKIVGLINESNRLKKLELKNKGVPENEIEKN